MHLIPPRKQSGFVTLLEKSSLLSRNPQHLTVTVNPLLPSLPTAIIMLTKHIDIHYLFVCFVKFLKLLYCHTDDMVADTGVGQSLLSVMTSDMPCDSVTWPISWDTVREWHGLPTGKPWVFSYSLVALVTLILLQFLSCKSVKNWPS